MNNTYTYLTQIMRPAAAAPARNRSGMRAALPGQIDCVLARGGTFADNDACLAVTSCGYRWGFDAAVDHVCKRVQGGTFGSQTDCELGQVIKLSMAPLANKWSETASFGGYIQNNVMVKLGEFTIHDSTCVTIDGGGIYVKIGPGENPDSMIVTILVIDKNAYDLNPHGAAFPFTSQYDNMIATTKDSDNIYNLFHDKGVVVAGQIPNSTVIANSDIPTLSRNTPGTTIKMTPPRTVKLPPGYYWVIAYFGVATDNTVEATLYPNNTVTFSQNCA